MSPDSSTTLDRRPAPLLSVVVPCMGRLHHLQQSAPALLAHPEVEYILVDYSCPDRCGDYARAHWPRAKVVEVAGEQYFNKGRALNAGIRAATGPWLANLDADNVVGPDFVRIVLSLVGDDVLVGHRAPNTGTAFFVCRPATFARTGGHNEAFTCWGGMDWDIRHRLLGLGLKLRLVPDDLIQIIEHSDEERTRFYEVKDRWASNRRQRRLAPFRLLLEQAVPWPDPTVFAVPSPDWWEVWRTIQYASFMQRLQGTTVRLYPYWRDPASLGGDATSRTDLTGPLSELLDVLAVPEGLALDKDCSPAKTATYTQNSYHYPCRHTPLTSARVRWRGWTDGPRRRIAYQFDGTDEVIRFDELGQLLAFAAEYELIEVRTHWPLRRAADVVAGCDLYVGLDSPVTQLCYAVGVPVLLIAEERHTAKALVDWHGDRPGLWCPDLADSLRTARWFLGDVRWPNAVASQV